jgi:O-methyltransferase involved in polyketide biosynthesis
LENIQKLDLNFYNVFDMIQNLKGISETLLVPLWARAVETKRPNHIIKDYKAVEMMEHIEYDFSKFDIQEMPQISIIIRTELLDKAIQAFMDKNPDAIIINLGCGLDTHFSRLDNGKVRWYDIDLSELHRNRCNLFCRLSLTSLLKKRYFKNH